MKTLLTKFLAFGSIGLLMLASCKKDETKTMATAGTAGTVTASAATLVMDKSKANSADPAVTFTFKSADYGFKAATSNVLQIDSMGDNWSKPQSITVSAKSTTQSFSTNDFNAILLKLRLPTDKSSQIQVRLSSAISNTISPVYTAPLTLTVTPYSLASSLYVPGAYQGWHPSSADSLVSPVSDGSYSGIINFTGTDLTFKVVTSRSESWNGTNYGAGTDAGTISSTGGNLTAPADGGLLVTVNTNNNTITYTPQWSIIGDATSGGWDNDTDMFYDKAHDTWYITANLVSDGTKGLKFRFKNDWTINLGGPSGTLSQNGPNISIPVSGTYIITLDANKNTYTLTKQ